MEWQNHPVTDSNNEKIDVRGRKGREEFQSLLYGQTTNNRNGIYGRVHKINSMKSVRRDCVNRCEVEKRVIT